MDEAPRFDPDAYCPKCGYPEVGTSYREDTSRYDCRRHFKYEQEHLHRTCERCQHRWIERPLTEDEVEELREAAEAEADEDGDGFDPESDFPPYDA